MTGLHLKMEAIPERRTAVLEGARLGQTEARPGDTLEVEATLHPYQAAEKVVRLKVKLPDSLTPGTMRVVVSDGATVDRMTSPPVLLGLQHSMALADTVAQMNRMHRERLHLCDAAGPRGAGGAGGAGAAGGAALDGECAGAAEGCAEDAVDGRERGGGWVDRDRICGFGTRRC